MFSGGSKGNIGKKRVKARCPIKGHTYLKKPAFFNYKFI